jgi:hypothetical protein
MIQLQADKVHKVLTFACRNCDYFEEAARTDEERGDKWLVYRNDLMAESKSVDPSLSSSFTQFSKEKGCRMLKEGDMMGFI